MAPSGNSAKIDLLVNVFFRTEYVDPKMRQKEVATGRLLLTGSLDHPSCSGGMTARISYPRLWNEPEDNGRAHLKVDGGGETDSFLYARMSRNTELVSSLVVPQPPQTPLSSIMACTLPIGQELALTCLLLERHRIIVVESVGAVSSEQNKMREAASSALVFIALLLTLYYSSKDRLHTVARKREKAAVRTVDGIILAAILRLLSAVLRTLTASYSSDTVAALAIGGMAVHLLACDYSYANGLLRDGWAPDSGGDSSGIGERTYSARDPGDVSRPTFEGGTVSLNAALFSTTLLASRLPTDAASYGFTSISVVMFAFYPDARHTIAAGAGGSAGEHTRYSFICLFHTFIVCGEGFLGTVTPE